MKEVHFVVFPTGATAAMSFPSTGRCHEIVDGGGSLTAPAIHDRTPTARIQNQRTREEPEGLSAGVHTPSPINTALL